MRPSIRKGSFAVLAAGLLSTGALAGLSGSVGAQSHQRAAASSSNVVLTMESSPIQTFTQNFNPLNNTSSLYLVAGTSFIYEPLIQFDTAKAGIIYPWLATSYSWGSGGKSITFTIRKGVKWNDGVPLTPTDVAFTYQTLMKYPATNFNGLPISGVSTSGNTVTVRFKVSQYPYLYQIAGSTLIIPEHIWSKVGNPSTYTDPNPVGTGPYTLGQFTPQGFTLVRNPNYWQESKVKIATLSFPAYASNTNAEEALFGGQLDWAGNFIPTLKQDFLSKSPYNMAYQFANSTVTLEPNLTRFPLNDLAVRQAVSDAVDRNAISVQGEAGQEPPATNAAGLTLPIYSAFTSPAVTGSPLSASPNVAAAKKVLEADGWTMGSNGYFQKGGKTLTFTISDPTAYTDYAADATIIANDLKKAGMNVSFNGETVTAWSSDVQSGNFDSIIHWANGGVNPYSPYFGWLSSTLIKNGGNYEQLNSPAVDAMLAKVAAASTTSAEASALVPVEQYVAKNLPVIPLVFGAAWSQVNASQTTGWPTAQNPYESAQPATPTNEVVVLHLSPRS
jgi:peptide/nickel transport system substrate-binding protein